MEVCARWASVRRRCRKLMIRRMLPPCLGLMSDDAGLDDAGLDGPGETACGGAGLTGAGVALAWTGAAGRISVAGAPCNGGLATTGPAGGLAAMAGVCGGAATTIRGSCRGWGTIFSRKRRGRRLSGAGDGRYAAGSTWARRALRLRSRRAGRCLLRRRGCANGRVSTWEGAGAPVAVAGAEAAGLAA